MKKIIITGDDFGLSPAVNEAIELAHRNGILNTTSLMVGESACVDAVERAKKLPNLRVGLHLTVVRAHPVLDPDQIPALLDPAGLLRNNLLVSGLRFFFLPNVRKQLAAEIRAQFDAFRATGLELDHVNAHNHMHLHPTVLNMILSIGKEYGLKAIRLPYEPVIARGHNYLLDRLISAGLSPWLFYIKRRLHQRSVKSNDYLFGLGHSGHMTVENTLDLLSKIPEGVSELYFHPAVRNLPGARPHDDINGSAMEFETLIDQKIKNALDQFDIKTTTFSDLSFNHA